jgi:hypothetical protein
MAKSSLFLGNLSSFEKALTRFNEQGAEFKVVSSGMSRKIVAQNSKKLSYFGRKENNDYIDGAFLAPMVMREINAYIEKNGVPAIKGMPDVQQFNFDAIDRVLGKSVAISSIDINSCYWNTARMLGYISEKLYQRGMNGCKKKGLLVAIGCLNKLPQIDYYKDGQHIKTDYDYETNEKYAPFYWNIIYHTYELMMRSYELFGDKFYMWLTDCVFVDTECLTEAEKFFEEAGYKTKTNTIDFQRYEGRRLIWYDFKAGREKGIYSSSRDIKTNYELYKISKGLAF